MTGQLTVETWLTGVDADVLDFYQNYALRVNPKTVHLNAETEAIQNSIHRSMRKLRDAGLLETEGEKGYYSLTETGHKLVAGELSKAEINELDPEPD